MINAKVKKNEQVIKATIEKNMEKLRKELAQLQRDLHTERTEATLQHKQTVEDIDQHIKESIGKMKETYAQFTEELEERKKAHQALAQQYESEAANFGIRMAGISGVIPSTPPRVPLW